LSPACSVALKPSPTLAAITGAGHALALAAAWSSLAGLPLAFAGAGIVLSGVWTAGDALLQWPGSVLQLELEDNGSGRWVDRAGREHPIQSSRTTWVSAGLVVLGMQTSRWRTRWLILLPDSGGAEALRRLRAWLKWRPS
jgi:hypothetical protein